LRGKFIVIEGPDGSGKSTQVKLLLEYLENKGLPVFALREPGGTAIGEKIRRILRDPALSEMTVRTEMFLYMASRAQIVEQIIIPELENGKIVIADRFLLSTVVYQGAAGGLGAKTVLEIGEIATGGLKPDLTIIVDLSEKKWISRKGLQRDGAQMNIFDEPPDREELKGIEFHKKVRKAYADFAAGDRAFALIDGDGDPLEVHGRIVKVVENAIR